MKVLVLGCGPAGLMAAQGVVDANIANGGLGDVQISIVSRKVPSQLFGAQYLHRPIPGATPTGPITVSYQLRGNVDDYRRKVYGSMWTGTVSPEDLMDEHQAWDIRGTYRFLWSLWHGFIQDGHVDPATLTRLMGDGPDLIINSIPRPSLCHEGHAFGSTKITAAGDAPELGIRLPFSCPEGMVVCNGEENPSWYRMSRVFGHTTVEWPDGITVPVSTCSVVVKPTNHDCNCFPDVKHVGRYGKWEKGVLSHTAYFDAFKMVDEMLGGKHEAAEG